MTRSRSAVIAFTLSAVFFAACEGDRPIGDKFPPPSCTVNPCSTAAVVAFVADAYQLRNYDRFAAILHPEFLFYLQPDPSNPGQPTSWDAIEEARIHRRMFDPQAFQLDPDPVPEELWLRGITIALTSAGPFVERPEHYASEGNPDGLDPRRYKAWGAASDDSVLFETQGDLDYQIIGQSYFVIAEDLTKSHGDSGAFLLYRWQDLGSGTISRSQSKSWSNIKGLYR